MAVMDAHSALFRNRPDNAKNSLRSLVVELCTEISTGQGHRASYQLAGRASPTAPTRQDRPLGPGPHMGHGYQEDHPRPATVATVPGPFIILATVATVPGPFIILASVADAGAAQAAGLPPCRRVGTGRRGGSSWSHATASL